MLVVETLCHHKYSRPFHGIKYIIGNKASQREIQKFAWTKLDMNKISRFARQNVHNRGHTNEKLGNYQRDA